MAAKKKAENPTVSYSEREKEMFACFEDVVIGLQETEKDILQKQELRRFLSTHDTVQWQVGRPAGGSPRSPMVESTKHQSAGEGVLLGSQASNKMAVLSLEKDESTTRQETEKDENIEQDERQDIVKKRDVNHNYFSTIKIAAASGAKILTCKLCLSSFVQLAQLEKHMAGVHGLETGDDVEHENFDSSSDNEA